MPRSTESGAPIVPIIGGGPAGMSCALWLHNYGMHPVIIGKENARRVAAAGRLHVGAAAVGELSLDSGSHVAVIGGGDNAFDVSRMLAESGVRVTIVMRSKAPRAQPLLVERLRLHQASGMATV